MAPKTKNGRLSISNMSDTNLLLAITMVVFVVMYASAIALLGAGFSSLLGNTQRGMVLLGAVTVDLVSKRKKG